MPNCGSQVILCDLPIRFDTYQGCTHNCEYCFTRKKLDISEVQPAESATALLNFIKGERNRETNWCDWNIPLHWGGLSDPFQPCEKYQRQSMKCLEVFKQTQYPFVVSTKGKLAGDPEYVKMLAECNCVVQVSLVDPMFNKYETGCPTFDERIDIIRKLVDAGVKRVNVRCQPYVPQIQSNLIKNTLPLYKEIGVHGVIFEGFKSQHKKAGMVKVAGDYAYPVSILEPRFLQAKKVCHDLGMKFYCGENRLRNLGDELCCCGIEEMQGFKGNSCNLNHYYKDPNGIGKPTEQMLKVGSTECFQALGQTTAHRRNIRQTCFYKTMQEYLLLGYNIFNGK